MDEKEMSIGEKMMAASKKLYEACPKMADPSWWDRGEDDREVEMPEETKKMVEENAKKAGVL